MRILRILASFFLLTTVAMGQTYRPRSGYVPDAKTAIAIAQAVLIPVYGAKQIASEQPLHASLKNNVWTVEGTLNCSDGEGGTTTYCNGGTALVRISKIDGRILKMIHYQ
jgi:NTF2 fold immunity protein